jgi:hypothetical protein
MERMMVTVDEELPKEMARVRELLPIYDAIPTGVFAATMMRADLDAAAKAMAEGDLAAMILRYHRLKDYTA